MRPQTLLPTLPDADDDADADGDGDPAAVAPIRTALDQLVADLRRQQGVHNQWEAGLQGLMATLTAAVGDARLDVDLAAGAAAGAGGGADSDDRRPSEARGGTAGTPGAALNFSDESDALFETPEAPQRQRVDATTWSAALGQLGLIDSPEEH